jgi:hypothetical protein
VSLFHEVNVLPVLGSREERRGQCHVVRINAGKEMGELLLLPAVQVVLLPFLKGCWYAMVL